MTKRPREEPEADIHEHLPCSCAISSQSLAIVLASLTSAQHALNAAQTALRSSSQGSPPIVVVTTQPTHEARPRYKVPRHNRSPSAILISDSESEPHGIPTHPPTPTHEEDTHASRDDNKRRPRGGSRAA